MSEAGSLVVGGLPGSNAATTTITTNRTPPSAPHRSHLLSSMVPLLMCLVAAEGPAAGVPCRRSSLPGGCARRDPISSTRRLRAGFRTGVSAHLREHLGCQELERGGRAAVVEEEDELGEAELDVLADAIDD